MGVGEVCVWRVDEYESVGWAGGRVCVSEYVCVRGDVCACVGGLCIPPCPFYRYIAATRDFAFLSEPISLYNQTTNTTTVLDALVRALNFTLQTVSVGRHNLTRMLSSDWDDTLQPPPSTQNVSESVLTAALATYALPRIASVLGA